MILVVSMRLAQNANSLSIPISKYVVHHADFQMRTLTRQEACVSHAFPLAIASFERLSLSSRDNTTEIFDTMPTSTVEDLASLDFLVPIYLVKYP